MKRSLRKMRESNHFALVLLATITLAIATSLFAQKAGDEPKSWASSQTILDQCTFSNGATMSFGGKASGTNESDGDVWLAGNYHATSFHVSDRLVLPPLDHPSDIPPGRYTLYIDTTEGNPILIISRKAGEPGMSYPGEQYDVARTELASDGSPRPSVETFAIGCTQYQSSPIFLWIKWGRHISYAKIVAVETQGGKTEYILH